MAEQLVVRELCSGYGRIPILFDIDLVVNRGDLVGLFGSNGMGKSTLMKTLAGQLRATKGNISFEGKDIVGLRPDQRAGAGIAYVPQGRQIFSGLSVLENLHMGALKHSRTAADAVVEKVVGDLPRLQPILDRKGGVLSGGEQQILALGRALCTEPSLLLLDEPTEGIQPSIVSEISGLLRKLSERDGLTIILVEQNIRFLKSVASKFRVLRKGTLSNDLDAAAIERDLTTAGTV